MRFEEEAAVRREVVRSGFPFGEGVVVLDSLGSGSVSVASSGCLEEDRTAP